MTGARPPLHRLFSGLFLVSLFFFLAALLMEGGLSLSLLLSPPQEIDLQLAAQETHCLSSTVLQPTGSTFLVAHDRYFLEYQTHPETPVWTFWLTPQLTRRSRHYRSAEEQWLSWNPTEQLCFASPSTLAPPLQVKGRLSFSNQYWAQAVVPAFSTVCLLLLAATLAWGFLAGVTSQRFQAGLQGYGVLPRTRNSLQSEV